MLPVEIVYHPSWWYEHEGIIFDEDFFFHPKKRVESEQLMEKALFSRFGKYGLGKNWNRPMPEIGAIHLAAGYFLSEVMGCQVDFLPDGAPQVHSRDGSLEPINIDQIISHKHWKALTNLIETLNNTYGYLIGDIDWGGVLNLALDLRGNKIFLDFFDYPEEVDRFLRSIVQVIDYFTHYIESYTGSTSISVNRSILNIDKKIFLHSECAHTMISSTHYQDFLLNYDIEWSKTRRPFGIHYCGKDSDRFAKDFAQIPHLDFLDVGWGSDIGKLRQYLPNTFFNLRLDPTAIAGWSDEYLYETINRLVKESHNYELTGICCINMDKEVSEKKVQSLFEIVEYIRAEQESDSRI